MKKETIQRFRQFMHTRALYRLFEGMYKQYRFADNPARVEEYLGTVNPFFVIVLAFDFNKIKNSQFDERFWQNMHTQWLNDLVLYAGINDEKIELRIEKIIATERNVEAEQLRLAGFGTDETETEKETETGKDNNVESVINTVFNEGIQCLTQRRGRMRTLLDGMFRIDLKQMRFVFSPQYSLMINQQWIDARMSLILNQGKLYFRIGNNEQLRISLYSHSQYAMYGQRYGEMIKNFFNVDSSKTHIYGEFEAEYWNENKTVLVLQVSDKIDID